MTSPATAYTPTSEADALSAALQITGDYGHHVLDGDWHQALTDFSHNATTPTPTTRTAVSTGRGLEYLERARTAIATLTH
ncbi:hypothetical protein [Streptomyces sp. NPDC058657]|uniref:hypothetical protein n=1 Tax=unclassified Streptomyces TaxID=2593676 RepID=UPI00364AA350